MSAYSTSDVAFRFTFVLQKVRICKKQNTKLIFYMKNNSKGNL